MLKMTRQKKEIEKKIDKIQIFIEVDTELGCGFAPPNAYAEMKEEIWRLQEQLAHLRYYNSVEEMLFDDRGQGLARGDMPSML